jgi:ribosomal protein S18 acetylase RimI-like enzyme
MDVPMIRSAAESERPAVLDVITLAFATDPVARWAQPNPTKYFSEFRVWADALGGGGLAHGATLVANGLEGAAMWLPPGVDPDVERVAELAAAAFQGQHLADVMGLFEQMGGYHPQEPCWYLPLVGVDPILQGRGFGGLLMRHAVRRSDADGVAAYLESSNPRNISLYLRHGFEILGTIQVGDSPTVTPMLRRPHQTT